MIASKILNVLFSIFILCFSVREFYYTYKEPSTWQSTNMKGYFGSIGLAVISILSIAGKFSFLNVVIHIFRKILKLQNREVGIYVALLLAFVSVTIMLIFCRPDKIYLSLISEEDQYTRLKSGSKYFLFYFASLIILLYLITKIWIIAEPLNKLTNTA